VSVTFVSIGDGEKLTKFLELNPDLPKDRCFVDESRTFDVYRAAGFGKIGDTKPTDINIKPPGFSFGQWFSYLANVATLAPSRKDEPLRGPPEGVLRLGGTFVLDGADVVYAHSEELPGTSPEVKDVLRDAKLA
jgi:hypothetical protein